MELKANIKRYGFTNNHPLNTENVRDTSCHSIYRLAYGWMMYLQSKSDYLFAQHAILVHHVPKIGYYSMLVNLIYFRLIPMIQECAAMVLYPRILTVLIV